MDRSVCERIEHYRSTTNDIRAYRKYSLVLAVATLKLSISKACKFFDYSLPSYYRIKQEVTDAATSQVTKSSWGGRRKSYLTQAQEDELAAELATKASSGGGC